LHEYEALDFASPLGLSHPCGITQRGDSLSLSPVYNWITERKLTILVVGLGIIGAFLFVYDSVLSKKENPPWTTSCFAFKS